MLNYGAADGVDPLFFLLIGVGDEVHGGVGGGELEGARLMDDVFGAFDGEARADGDNAARSGGA